MLFQNVCLLIKQLKYSYLMQNIKKIRLVKYSYQAAVNIYLKTNNFYTRYLPVYYKL